MAITDGAASDGRNRVILFSGAPGANCTVTVTPNDAEKWYFVYNGVTGGYNVIMAQGGGSGSTVTVASGYWALVRMDGTGSNANVTRLLDSWEVTTALKAATYTSASTLSIKPGADSTAAIRLQNSAGTQKAALDTTNSRFIIGTTTPGSTFEVNSNTVAVTPDQTTDVNIVGSDSGTGNRVMITGITNSAAFIGRLGQGTGAALTAVQNASYLCQLQGRGYLTNTWSSNLGRVAFVAEENFTNSTAKTAIVFEVTPAGAITSSEKMRLTGAGQLELSTTTGGLLVPRLTTTQRDALTPSNGLIIYNTTTAKFQGYEAGAWANLI